MLHGTANVVAFGVARRANQCRLVPNTAPAEPKTQKRSGRSDSSARQSRPLRRRAARGGRAAEEAECAVQEAVARQQHAAHVDGAVEDRARPSSRPASASASAEQRGAGHDAWRRLRRCAELRRELVRPALLVTECEELQELETVGIRGLELPPERAPAPRISSSVAADASTISAWVAVSAATQYCSVGIDVTNACWAKRSISWSNSSRSPEMSSSLRKPLRRHALFDDETVLPAVFERCARRPRVDPRRRR